MVTTYLFATEGRCLGVNSFRCPGLECFKSALAILSYSNYNSYIWACRTALPRGTSDPMERWERQAMATLTSEEQTLVRALADAIREVSEVTVAGMTA